MQWSPALCCFGKGQVRCTTGEPLCSQASIVSECVIWQQVNLVPADRPQDVYSEVAVLVRDQSYHSFLIVMP